MEYVKLTDGNLRTRGGTQWEKGVAKRTSGEGPLCSPGWLHCYGASTQRQALLLAVLLNPIHANVRNPRAWRVEVGGRELQDSGLKYGFSEMTISEELTVPAVTPTQMTAFGILCALEVCPDEPWRAWAYAWLLGEDRTTTAAWAAAEAAPRASAATEAAARAAWAAATAAWTAEGAAEGAAWAAAMAAWTAAWTAAPLDLGAIAEKAMEGTLESCTCDECKAACLRPCWGSPAEAAEIMAAGLGGRLMLDYWVRPNGDIQLLCPACTGREGRTAPLFPLGRCTFQGQEGLCELHAKGLKPTEGRLGLHGESSGGRHEEMAKMWDTEEGRLLVRRWKLESL